MFISAYYFQVFPHRRLRQSALQNQSPVFSQTHIPSIMKQIPIWACLISLFLLINAAESDEEQAKDALLQFISKLSRSNGVPDPNAGWNSSSFPCRDRWKGITCNDENYVQEISLNGYDFPGVFDVRLLCRVQSISASLSGINVANNNIRSENLEDIEKCLHLNQLNLTRNQISGNIPNTLSQLENLNVLDLSHNQFSGPLPDLSPIQGLTVFRAENNHFSGPIPGNSYSNLLTYNVSYNNIEGAIPDWATHYTMDSFIHNPGLCGGPLPNSCLKKPSSSDSESESTTNPPTKQESNHRLSTDQILMFSGYALIALAVVILVLLCFYKRACKKKQKTELLELSDNKVFDDSMTSKASFSTVELKGKSTTDASVDQSGPVSQSMVVLESPDENGLKFEELLKSPAEMLGRGTRGSVYKVDYEGKSLVVKRIRDWTLSSSEFKQRMRRLNQVKHPNVLPAVAFYSSRQEKLLVYEYQKNGSLFKLIHAQDNQVSPPLDWSSRLSMAGTAADALAFMHEHLHYDRIPHGNLKSSNILLNNNMEPCISEYGLMIVDQSNRDAIITNAALQEAQEDYISLYKEDTYAFGVILLELLTGKMVITDGLDLANWVVAVLREEWTVEVFDKNLVREGASEERLVGLLQVAIKCIGKLCKERPSMKEVANMIRAIREEDERSMDVSEVSAMTRSFVDV